MPGKAKSITAKKRAHQTDQKEKFRLAINDYRKYKAIPGQKKSYRTVGEEFGVDWSTLRRLDQGGISIAEFNVSKQLLTPAEEEGLVILAELSSDRGFPLDLNQLHTGCTSLLRLKLGPETASAGKNWADRFVERHAKRLQTFWSKPLDSSRAEGLNPAAVNHWFYDIIKPNIYSEGEEVLPENIYGMDEAGFPPSASRPQRVIGRRGRKGQHRQGGASRENVTALCTICADGSNVTPHLI